MMTFHQHLLRALVEARAVAVLTGAGVSAESGVATFRDPNGLWAKFRPEELASMDGFLKNPALVWEWYQARREVIERVTPNPGHYALAAMQAWYAERGGALTLITQNVDRLHHRAGSTDVLELHGNIVENYCSRCTRPHDYRYSDNPDVKEPPRCSYCGGMIRPAVVWFGEMLPVNILAAAHHAAEHCDVFLSIGTSAEVYPAAGLPLEAKQHGALLVEINPHPTVLTRYADEVIAAPSGEALPQLFEQMRLLSSAASI
ncbi:MAG: NAD-dependent deacylase [Bacteroidota bacterium]|nr:NAD-dependent deacylase [Candidatus Kapabacteria bacterium]MDW8219750.1 NAD-dependent deacylase [Bacteroidota bacterium]